MSAPHSSGRIRYGRRHRVVDHERDAVGVRDAGNPLDVEHVVLRVRHDLAVEHLRVRLDRRLPLGEVVRVVDEGDLDAELGHRVVEQVVRAAVERRRGDDVVTGFAQRHQRQRLGGLTRGDGERAGQPDRGDAATLECVDTGFERRLRRVHDAGVDVADLGQPEQVRRVLGVAELVRRRLVDRHRPGTGRRVGLAADMDLLGLESPLVTHRAETLPVNSRPHKSTFRAIGHPEPEIRSEDCAQRNVRSEFAGCGWGVGGLRLRGGQRREATRPAWPRWYVTITVTGIQRAEPTNWRQPSTESEATNNPAPTIAQPVPRCHGRAEHQRDRNEVRRDRRPEHRFGSAGCADDSQTDHRREHHHDRDAHSEADPRPVGRDHQPDRVRNVRQQERDESWDEPPVTVEQEDVAGEREDEGHNEPGAAPTDRSDRASPPPRSGRSARVACSTVRCADRRSNDSTSSRPRQWRTLPANTHDAVVIRSLPLVDDARNRSPRAAAMSETRRSGGARSSHGCEGRGQPPEMSETFCLPARMNGIMSRSSPPISSIGCALPSSCMRL